MEEKKMSFEELLERLAEIKTAAKALGVESDAIMEELKEHHELPQQYVTDYGKLCLTKKENWVTIDQGKLIKTMTAKLFMEGATISKAKVVKLGGSSMLDKLVKNKSMGIKSVSKYYTLRKN